MSHSADYALHLQQGAATVLRLTYTDKETDPPTPIDLTGYEVRVQIRRSYHDDTADLELLSTAGEITITGAGNNIITATFPKDKVNALEINNQEVQDWVYGLQIFDPLDEDTTARMLLSGSVTVSPSPVRDDP